MRTRIWWSLVAVLVAGASIAAGIVLWAFNVLDAGGSASVALVGLTLDAVFLATMAAWFALQSAKAAADAIGPLTRLANMSRAQECRGKRSELYALEQALGLLHEVVSTVYSPAADATARAACDRAAAPFPEGSLPEIVELVLRPMRSPSSEECARARAAIRNRVEAIESELRVLESGGD